MLQEIKGIRGCMPTRHPIKNCCNRYCWKLLTSHGQEEWSQLCIHLCQQGLLQHMLKVRETAQWNVCDMHLQAASCSGMACRSGLLGLLKSRGTSEDSPLQYALPYLMMGACAREFLQACTASQLLCCHPSLQEEAPPAQNPWACSLYNCILAEVV